MKVLLASDGSKASEEAARLLSRLPHHDPLQLTVLTVLSPPVTAFYSPTKQFIDQIVADDRKFAQQRQQVLGEMFEGADATVECVTLEGRAEEQIVEHAKQIDADLIVLGATGHSQIDRILLGSTSDYVATHAPCSVLVVRPGGQRQEGQRDLSIAIAYDASGASQAALEEILEFDWKAHCEFTVCTVAGYNPIFDPEYGFNTDGLRDEAVKSLRLAKEQLQPKVHSVQEKVLEHVHVAEGLVKFTEEQHSDCIVIGETKRSTIARALLGSVSRYVLRHATCSVWITRNRTIEGLSKGGENQSSEMAETP